MPPQIMGTNSMLASPPGLWAAQLYHHERPAADADGANAAAGPSLAAMPRLHRVLSTVIGASPDGASAVPLACAAGAPPVPPSREGGSRIGSRSLVPQAASAVWSASAPRRAPA